MQLNSLNTEYRVRQSSVLGNRERSIPSRCDWDNPEHLLPAPLPHVPNRRSGTLCGRRMYAPSPNNANTPFSGVRRYWLSLRRSYRRPFSHCRPLFLRPCFPTWHDWTFAGGTAPRSTEGLLQRVWHSQSGNYSTGRKTPLLKSR